MREGHETFLASDFTSFANASAFIYVYLGCLTIKCKNPPQARGRLNKFVDLYPQTQQRSTEIYSSLTIIFTQAQLHTAFTVVILQYATLLKPLLNFINIA